MIRLFAGPLLCAAASLSIIVGSLFLMGQYWNCKAHPDSHAYRASCVLR